MESDGVLSNGFIGLILLQVTVALGAGLAASYALRNHPARAHRALTLALVAAVVLPAASLAVRELGLGLLKQPARADVEPSGYEFIQQQGAIDVKKSPDALPPTSAKSHDIGTSPPPKAGGSVSWHAIAPWLWGVGSALAVLYFVASFLGGLRILRSARLVTETSYTEGARHASDNLGLEVTPTIFASGAVRSPSVWCWRVHPALLVPQTQGADEARGLVDACSPMNWHTTFGAITSRICSPHWSWCSCRGIRWRGGRATGCPC